MKQTIKKYLIPVVALSFLILGSCSDWTEPGSLDIHTPSFEEQYPDLYKKYIEAVRVYKETDHQVTYVTMRNSTETPAQRNEHLTTMPDSVDFICLTTPADLHPVLVKEMDEVREKGTRVTYKISYDEIEKRWKEILEEEAKEAEGEGEGEGEPEPEPEPGEPEGPTDQERFLEFCKEQTETQLAYCNEYGFDGIELVYSGRAPASMHPEEREEYADRQEVFFSTVMAWYEKNDGKLLFFRGYPQNLIDNEFLAGCEYIIIPAINASSSDELSYAILMAIVGGVPTDRFLVAVTIPSIVDPTEDAGYFGGFESDGKTRVRATKGVAMWAVNPVPHYTKAGIAVDDAQNDYFNITKVYKNISEAIDIMNPSPKH